MSIWLNLDTLVGQRCKVSASSCVDIAVAADAAGLGTCALRLKAFNVRARQAASKTARRGFEKYVTHQTRLQLGGPQDDDAMHQQTIHHLAPCNAPTDDTQSCASFPTAVGLVGLDNDS